MTRATLRAWLEARLAGNGPLGLQDALGIVVPLCVEIAEVHAQGYGAYVYPSNLAEAPRAGGFGLVSELVASHHEERGGERSAQLHVDEILR